MCSYMICPITSSLQSVTLLSINHSFFLVLCPGQLRCHTDMGLISLYKGISLCLKRCCWWGAKGVEGHRGQPCGWGYDFSRGWGIQSVTDYSHRWTQSRRVRERYAFSLRPVVSLTAPDDHVKWVKLTSLRITKRFKLPRSQSLTPYCQINVCFHLGGRNHFRLSVEFAVSQLDYLALLKVHPAHLACSRKSFSFKMASRNHVSTVNKLTCE